MNSYGKHFWTDAEINKLRWFYREGYRHAFIASQMGRTRIAVNKKMADLGLCIPGPSKPVSDTRKKCVAWRRKYTASEIGAMLGISRDAVIGHWHRHDVRQRRAALAVAP